MNRNYALVLLSLVLVPVGIGCGPPDKGPKTVPAEGTVTLDGAPVEGAAVVFVDSAGKHSAQGRTDEEGHFSLNAFEYKTGAVPGTYMAIVRKTVVDDNQPPPPAGSEESEHEGDPGGGGGVRNVMPKHMGSPIQNGLSSCQKMESRT